MGKEMFVMHHIKRHKLMPKVDMEVVTVYNKCMHVLRLKWIGVLEASNAFVRKVNETF
jgi:hypothetical protein